MQKNISIVGTFFLTVMVSSSIGDELMGFVINAQDYLNNMYQDKLRVIPHVRDSFILKVRNFAKCNEAKAPYFQLYR